MNPQQNWRAEIVKRNVLAGKQGRVDLDDLDTQGRITSPAQSLYRTLALEAAKDIDAQYDKRRSRRMAQLGSMEV